MASTVAVYKVHYILMAQDMERAVRFWSEVFGFEAPPVNPYWVEIPSMLGTIALHGGHYGAFNATGLGITVIDIHAAVATAVAAGASIRRAPVARPGEPIMLADLTDTEGNGFSLSQELAEPNPR